MSQPAMSQPTLPVPRLELRSLLSSCMSLTKAACEVIREVQEARLAQVLVLVLVLV